MDFCTLQRKQQAALSCGYYSVGMRVQRQNASYYRARLAASLGLEDYRLIMGCVQAVLVLSTAPGELPGPTGYRLI